MLEVTESSMKEPNVETPLEDIQEVEGGGDEQRERGGSSRGKKRKEPSLVPKVLRGSIAAYEKTMVSSIAVFPDDTRFVTAGWDNAVKVWTSATLELLAVLNGCESLVTAVVVTLDGGQVIACSNIIYVWMTPDSSSSSLSPCRTIDNAHAPFRARTLALTPSGNTLISGSEIGGDSISMWNLSTFECEGTMSGRTGSSVVCICVSVDGKYVMSACERSIRVWDIASLALRGTLEGHKNYVRSIAVFPNNFALVVSASSDRTLCVWDIHSLSLVHCLKGAAEMQYVCVSPDGTRLLGGDAAGRVHVWDASTYEEVQTLPCRGKSSVHSLAVSLDYERIFVGTNTGRVYVWVGESINSVIPK